MRKRPILIFVLLATAFSASGYWLLKESFWITSRWDGALKLFSSSEELFVFTVKRTSVVKESLALTLLRGFAGAPGRTEKISEELLVFHYKDGQFIRSKVAPLGGGAPFAFRGHVYFGRGRLPNDHGPYHWRWNGSSFVALSGVEWAELDRDFDREFKLLSESNLKEGWTEGSLVTYGRKPETTLTLQGKELKIIGRNAPLSWGKNRFTVTLNAPDGKILEVLVDEVEGWKKISAKEYQELKAQNARS